MIYLWGDNSRDITLNISHFREKYPTTNLITPQIDARLPTNMVDESTAIFKDKKDKKVASEQRFENIKNDN